MNEKINREPLTTFKHTYKLSSEQQKNNFENIHVVHIHVDGIIKLKT